MSRAPDTPTTVRLALEEAGLAPLKRYGQNFLIDPRFLDRVAKAAETGPGDVVFEVGPGLGGLTERLLATGARVVATEIDRGLAARLRRVFAADRRLTLVEEDVLDGPRGLARGTTAALASAAPDGAPWSVAANLPYGITSPFLLALLDAAPGAPKRVVVMVQKEVADVLAARPGDEDYSVLSLAARTYWDVRRLFEVGPEAFYPRPDVDSSVVVLLPADGPTPPSRPFIDFARGLFQSRRKTLRSSLRRAHPEVDAESALRAAGLRPEDRVDGVAPERVAALFQAIGS